MDFSLVLFISLLGTLDVHRKGTVCRSRVNFTDAYAAARTKSAACYLRASAVLGGNVGHDLRYFEPMPLYIERGRAGRKWDVDGNEYIDFLMGNGALLLGHADPEVIDAIASAASRGRHFGNDHPLQIEWAELIREARPFGRADTVREFGNGSQPVGASAGARVHWQEQAAATRRTFSTAGTTSSLSTSVSAAAIRMEPTG